MDNIEEFDPNIFRKIFSDSPFGVCIISSDGCYLEVNSSFVNLLGYDHHHDLIGKKFEDITHPEDLEIDKELTQKIFSGEIPRFEIEKRFIKKNGEIIWAKLHASTYGDSLGIGILESIEARSHYELQMARLQKDLDQFVYKTSHDLRSPITNILGLTKLAAESGNYEEYIQMINENTLKLDHIIREICDYSINQRFDVKYEMVDLEATIDQVYNAAIQEIRTPKNINLQKTIRYNKEVIFDRARLVIILKNLMLNAISFTKKNGIIEVCSTVENSSLFFKIRDEGVGIRKDVQTKIYDMFYRGSSISEGAGLGLYIVKQTVEELKGTISFETEEGKGTEFTIQIPLPVQG